MNLLEEEPELAGTLTDKMQMLQFCFLNEMYPQIVHQGQFDEQEFVNYLKFSNLMSDQAYSMHDSDFKENHVLFEQCTITQMDDFLYKKYIWEEGFRAMGYPFMGKDEAQIVPLNLWGISSQSDKKEEAWKIIEMFFKKEYRKSYTPWWNFSAVMEELQYQINEAGIKKTFIGTDGTTQEIPRISYQDGDETKEIFAAEAEDLEVVKGLIDRGKVVFEADGELLNIINEEAKAYFIGQKKAEEVASIVGNRVMVYMKEKD